MTDRPRTTGDDRSQDTAADGFGRREFVALGAGASAALLAGCAGDGALPSSDGSDGSDGSSGSDGDSNALTGGFRLLISDAPADIGDFDSLDVTLSEARIFEASDGDDEDDEESDADEDGEDADSESDGDETNQTESPNGTAEEDDESEDDENGEEEDEDDEAEDDEEDRGFTVVDLEGATVDLTRVIEKDATAVFDGEIPAGSYEKVELAVSKVEGVVDGEAVDVKLPSEKLQITNGFEVTPEEPVSFVFDINVVKRGQNNGYILKPVISGSGVAGRDVEVNEIDDDEGDDGDGDDESDDADGDESESDDESGRADDEESGSTTNESEADGTDGDDAQNGTATGSGD